MYKEIVVVELNAKMRNYIVMADDRRLLRGNPTKYWPMKYYLTFERNFGIRTTDMSNVISISCPYCGAQLSMNSLEKCQQCGATITSGGKEWKLANITKSK